MVRLTHLLSLRSRGPLATWRPDINTKKAESWRRYLALIYAMCAWTMFGGVAYWHYTRKDDEIKAPSEDAERLQDAAELNPSEQEKTPAYTYKIVYKENFVPYTTRIYQYFTSSGKQSANSSIDK